MASTIDTPVPVRAVAIFDFDGTLVSHIDHGKVSHPQIEEMKAEMRSIQEEGGVIVGNTGRPPELIHNDKTELMELPFEYICSSLGTVILERMVGEEGRTTFQPMQAYEDYLSIPLDPNKTPYDKATIDALLAAQEGFTLQEPFKIGDSPRTGAYFTFKLPEGVEEADKEAFITSKIAEVKEQVTELIGINNTEGIEALCGVSKEKAMEDGTVILNVDVMPGKADKIGATKWLLNHIAEKRKEAGQEPLNSVIIAGDSGNDLSNMDTAYYLSKGLHPAYVVPGNGHHDLVKHAQNEVASGAIAFVADAVPSTLPDPSNHINYGLGGSLQGLQCVREQLRERLKQQEVSATISNVQPAGRVDEPGRYLA